MREFQNKIVLITGGGTGIGKATAASFLARGARVTVVGRRGTVLEETTNELGPASDSIVADVGDRGMPQTIVDAIIAKHGRLDILVNNAGRRYRRSPSGDERRGDREDVPNERLRYLGPVASGAAAPDQDRWLDHQYLEHRRGQHDRGSDGLRLFQSCRRSHHAQSRR